jgi:hypothetical protein
LEERRRLAGRGDRLPICIFLFLPLGSRVYVGWFLIFSGALMRRLRGCGVIGTVYVLTVVVSVFIALGTSGISASKEASGWMAWISINVLIQMMNGFVVQRAVNRATNDPAGQSNSRFSAVNYIWVVVGVCYWVLGFLFLVLQRVLLL